MSEILPVCPDAFQAPGEAQTRRLTVEEYVYISHSDTLAPSTSSFLSLTHIYSTLL